MGLPAPHRTEARILEIALLAEGQEGIGWDDWLALAQACEASGFAGLFRSDHYSTGDADRDPGALDAWAVLAGLAAVTSQIRLGTLVSPVTFRHPSVLAKTVVTVDHISGGRAELGIGSGWMESEHRWWGFPFPAAATRREMLEEQAEIIRRQWDGEEFSFTGRHYRLEDWRGRPRPRQRPHPPLIIGGQGGPRSAGVAARWADEYNTTHATPADCRRYRRVLDEACERQGRDPASLRFSVMTGFLAGTTPAEVLEHAGRLSGQLGQGRDTATWLADVRSSWLVGTIDELAAQVAAYQAAGVQRLMLQHHAFDDLGLVELIGRELIPRVS
jgi:F420-dependent oxidoreductase-like protein